MLIVQVKDGESIDRALKRYKRKYDKTGVVKQLRSRQQFTKPSVILRQGKLRAAHKQRASIRLCFENILSPFFIENGLLFLN